MNRNNSVQSYRAAWLLMVMFCLLGETFAQDLPDAAPPPEQPYLDLIEQRQEASGLVSPDLIEPLMALAEHYYQQQDYALAAENFASARQIARVNFGIDTPLQLHALARHVAAEEALGDLGEAWQLEQSLLYIAGKNVGSAEALPIFRAAAMKRLNIWRRYRDGDFPPEITLGCYYDRSKLAQSFYGLGPSDIFATERRDCGAGERHIAMLSLLVEARIYTLSGVDNLLENGRYASDELQALVVEVLDLSNEIQRRQLTTYDPMLGNLMERLLAHQPEDTDSTVSRARFLLQLADMNVLRARLARNMSGFRAVHEQYAQAWRELQGSGIEQSALVEMFTPSLPVVLPSFTRNPLTRVAEAEAGGHIDVSFEITDQGKSRRVEITGTSENVQRADIREIKSLLERSSFRPRIVDGQVLKIGAGQRALLH